MSLVTTPTSALATCPRCGGTRVTAIDMTLTDGSAVAFISCHSCEHRSWTQAGAPLDVPTVLKKATKAKPEGRAGRR